MLAAGVFKHLTVSAEPSGEVNQRNVSSRSEALSPGPESTIFQLLGKNMCSRKSYKILSKSATALANHMSLVTALKDFLHLRLLGSSSMHSIFQIWMSSWLCPHVRSKMLRRWLEYILQIISLDLGSMWVFVQDIHHQSNCYGTVLWKSRKIELFKNNWMWCWTHGKGCFACCQMR